MTGCELDQRVGPGTAADGDDARASLTTGYFAHAESPAVTASSTSASIADFSPEFMRVVLFLMRPRLMR
jgi:hypothetical protein